MPRVPVCGCPPIAQVMPTLDYYGFEHEDAITGFVAEYEAQVFNRCVFGRRQGLLLMHYRHALWADAATSLVRNEQHLPLHCQAVAVTPCIPRQHRKRVCVSFMVPATTTCLRRPAHSPLPSRLFQLPQGWLGRLPPGHPAGGGEGQGQHLHPGRGAPVGRALRAALRQAPHHAGATTTTPLAALARLNRESVQQCCAQF